MTDHILDHDPTAGVTPVRGELPPEDVQGFPTRSTFDPMGEVAGYGALARGAGRRRGGRLIVAIAVVAVFVLPMAMNILRMLR